MINSGGVVTCNTDFVRNLQNHRVTSCVVTDLSILSYKNIIGPARTGNSEMIIRSTPCASTRSEAI